MGEKEATNPYREKKSKETPNILSYVSGLHHFAEALRMKDQLSFQPSGNDWNITYSYEHRAPLEVLEKLFWNFSFKTILNRFQTIDNEIGCSNRRSNVPQVEHETVNLENCRLA